MDRTEISEIFCGAVDTIINARLQNLAYDITKQFVVTKNDLSRQGLYTVSDGSVSFEAYSYDKTLQVNDKVMVTIPNGDYSQHKIITAKIEPELPDASTYASQLDLMQVFTDNIITTNTIETFENDGLVANDEGTSSFIQLCTLRNNKGNLSGFSRLGISAEFQSLLNNLDVVKGSYGLKIFVHTAIPREPGTAQKTGIYELYLDAVDMIGNPYQYSAFSKQEKVIDISMIENIAEIEVYFYQNGDFKDSNGNLINWEYLNNILEIPHSSYPKNLFVRNLQLYLGYEIGEYTNDKMQIYCANLLRYSYADIEKTKHLQLKWMHKFDNGKYKFVDMSSLKDIGIDDLKWFRRNLNVKDDNSIAGRGWEELPATGTDKFKCDFIPDSNEPEERIKVIAYKVDTTYESTSKLASNADYRREYRELEENRASYTESGFEEAIRQLQYRYLKSIESIITYSSEELVLTNTVKIYDTTTLNAVSALSIYYEDGSEGNYFTYDASGKLNTTSKGKGYERRLIAIYNGQEITNLLGDLDWIKWYLPTGKSSKTMLADTNEYYVKNNGIILKDNVNYPGNGYICICRYPDKNGDLCTKQSYSINNVWNSTYNNNLIRCEVSINGVRYTANSTMRFGKSGTQGSNTTLVLDFLNNQNAITIPVPKDTDNKDIVYTVEANAFDINGDLISVTSGEWEWEWKTPMIKNKEDKEVLILTQNENAKNQVNITANISSLQEIKNGYYGILKATFKQVGETALSTYLTIPLKAPYCSHIEGATEITYSSSGSPSYYADAYRIYKNVNDIEQPFKEETENIDWDVVHALEFYKLDRNGNPEIDDTGEKVVSAMSADYIPKLHQIQRTNPKGYSTMYQALQAAPFYAEGYDEICVMCLQNNGNYKSVGKLPIIDYKSSYYYIYNNTNGQYILSLSYEPNIEYFELEKDILWIQPLLITSDVYGNSTINNWDGTLMTDEGSSTVMASIIGAGRKNADNTFSGILMGEVKDSADTSSNNFVQINTLTEANFYNDLYYYKDESGNFVQAISYNKDEVYYALRQTTGLYGFQNGEISFSLKDNGVATFGKASQGQIIIDGNKSIITSRSYDSIGSGMHLDIDDGILTIKDDDKVKVSLTPGANESGVAAPYLLINGINANRPIMKISNDDYYLQSQQYSLDGFGAKMDLVKGTLNIRGTGGTVLLSGLEEDPFFKVTTRQGATLINMDVDDYYLQSAYFSNESQIRTTKDELQLEIYQEKAYIPVAISPEAYESETYKYFIHTTSKDENGNDIYIEASGPYRNFPANTALDNGYKRYFRKGNPDILFGFDSLNNNLYTLNYDNEKEEYTAKTPIDVYEVDDNGNFIYPIIWYVDRYEEDYTTILINDLDTFEEYRDQLYISVNNVYQPIGDADYDSVKNNTFYTMDYIPVQGGLSEEEEEKYKEASWEELIGIQIAAYKNRELEPVTIEGVPSGMKLNLVDGRIEGYNLKLIGTKINKETGKIINRLIINTENDEIPMQVGNNFKVHWDGEIECTKVTKISYTPIIPDSPGVYSANATTGYTLNLVDGTFDGTAGGLDMNSELVIQQLDSWWNSKNSDINNPNYHANWGYIKSYLENNYLSLTSAEEKYVQKSHLPDFSNYALAEDLSNLIKRVEDLERAQG